MSRLITAYTVLALSTCLSVPMLAQTTNQPSSAPPSQDQGMSAPSTPAPSTDMQSSPAQSQTTATDLTGQTIYTSKGRAIGKVSAMTTDAQGQQAASVSIERFLGMGGQTVAIPVSSLQARSSGGYSTSLTASQIKSLAKSGGSTAAPQ